MESGEKRLLGPLNGTFTFKKHADGAVDRSIVLCSFCNKEFSYHRSTSSLKYHLNAKHAQYVAVRPGVRASTGLEARASSAPQPAALDPASRGKLSKSRRMHCTGLQSAAGPQGDTVSGPKPEPGWDETEKAEAIGEAEIEVEVEDSVQATQWRRRDQHGPGDPAMLEAQQRGFDVLQRELGALRRTMNTRLRRMESRVYPLLVSVDDSLRRLANAAERWAPPPRATGSAPASTSARSTDPPRCLRMRGGGRRGRAINIWL